MSEKFSLISFFLFVARPRAFTDVAQPRFPQAGTKVGPDQLGPPVRVGSTRIVSDHEKKTHKIK